GRGVELEQFEARPIITDNHRLAFVTVDREERATDPIVVDDEADDRRVVHDAVELVPRGPTVTGDDPDRRAPLDD
ncbi:MAG: hypothetical protein M3046_14170, partial [Actinomycetota bacterium]|nr:hypothetical protein [Actinomycetota bacterium]